MAGKDLHRASSRLWRLTRRKGPRICVGCGVLWIVACTLYKCELVIRLRLLFELPLGLSWDLPWDCASTKLLHGTFHQAFTRGPINKSIPPIWPPLDPSNPFIFIKIAALWAWQTLWGYGRKVHAKFWPWGMPWDPSYDHFCVPCCHPTCKSLLMKFS